MLYFLDGDVVDRMTNHLSHHRNQLAYLTFLIYGYCYHLFGLLFHYFRDDAFENGILMAYHRRRHLLLIVSLPVDVISNPPIEMPVVK